MRALSAFAAALVLTGAASADVRTVEITYTERDLIDPARVEALQTRIKRAAEHVCDVRGSRVLWERRLAAECAKDAEERANAQLNRAVAAAGAITIAAR